MIKTERFIIRGLCDSCGELLGTLKPMAHLAAYAGWPVNKVRIDDPVVYHVAHTLTKTRMKCHQQ